MNKLFTLVFVNCINSLKEEEFPIYYIVISRKFTEKLILKKLKVCMT